MKRFDVIVSEDAKHDFKAAHDYIEFSLHNPSAADSLLEKIIEERDCRRIEMRQSLFVDTQ